MRVRIGAAAAVVALLGAVALSGTASAAPPSCNWGQLTSNAILEFDFEQGAHSSDPSDDGKGPEDRVGLANVVNQGDLEALCNFIDSEFP